MLGELKQVTDHLGGKVDYSYDPQGNMEQLVATGTTSSSGLANGVAGSITTTLDYDLLGRKIKMVDPDKGTWHYHYNVFGELTAQLDAKNQCSVITYDLLGRQLTRKDFGEDSQIASVSDCATSSGNLEGNTSWVYNNAISPFVSNGLGQLRDVMDLVSGYIKMIGYDYYGRPEETVTSLGVSGVDGDHYEKATYDQFGRTFQVYDAARDTDDYGDNAIEYRYNSYGYLHQVVDAVYINSQTRSTYYEVMEMDERGNVKKELLGNGYTTTRTYDPKTGRLTHIGAGIGATLNTIQDIDYDWDQLGNLEERHTQSGSKDIEETFQYEGLNRLTRAEVTGGDYTITSFDAYGNIKDKNTYDSTGAQNTNASVGTYTYDGPSGGPHAVTATTLGNLTYQYDANGNLTQNDMADGDTRTIQYTTFDKPGEIVKGNHKTEFEYGPDRARYKRIDTNTSNSEVTTTLYIGSVEKITNPDGTKAIKRYINGVAIVTQNYDSGNSLTSTDTRYLYKDHLGSMDFITDEFGTIQQEMSFDAWGKRRNAVDWESLSLTLLFNFDSSNTTRGFTGHEMLDEVGLVHMNGRIYDPHIGRFVQADPFVQDLTNSQGLNRYSYVYNNPLSLTDPSGYFSFGDLIKAVVNIVFSIAAYVACGGGATGAACAGAVSGLLAVAQGTTLKEGLAIGAFTFVAFQIGEWLKPGEVASGGAAESANVASETTKAHVAGESLTAQPQIAASVDVALEEVLVVGSRASLSAGQSLKLVGIGGVAQAFGTSIAPTPDARSFYTKSLEARYAPEPGFPNAIEVLAQASTPPWMEAGIIGAGVVASIIPVLRPAAGKALSGSGQARYAYDASVGRYRDLQTGRFVAQKNLPYPGNAGFASSTRGTVSPGTIIDRFGSPSGRFAGQPGATISQRGLPPGAESLSYSRYKVIRPIQAEIGPAAAVPQFGATGGARQYLFNSSIDDLVNNGYLMRLP